MEREQQRQQLSEGEAPFAPRRSRPHRAWVVVGALVGVGLSASAIWMAGDAAHRRQLRIASAAVPVPPKAQVRAAPDPTTVDPSEFFLQENETPPKPVHVVHELEQPPVTVVLAAQTQGIDLAAEGAPHLALDPKASYRVRAEGWRMVTQAMVSGMLPPNVRMPAQVSAQRFAAPAIATALSQSPISSALTAVLIGIENASNHSLTLRILDEHEVLLEHVSGLYAFDLTDRSQMNPGDTLRVVVRSDETETKVTPATLYVDDDQRLLVRVLDPHRGYGLGLEALPGTFTACIAAGPTGSRAPAAIAGQHSLGSLYALSPGAYLLRGATSLWCTVPHAGPSSAQVRMTLNARR